MCKPIPLIAMVLLCITQSEAAFTAAVDPSSGDLSIQDGSEKYLGFSYYDWGPDWSGVHRKKSTAEVGNQASFTFRNQIIKTGVPFTINGSWSHPQANQIGFDATLVPGGTSEMGLSQFSLSTGGAFAGTEAAVILADGSTAAVAIPFGRGTLGQGVVGIQLKDRDGRTTLIKFSEPINIDSDRGDARIPLAQDRITEGKKETLQFTVQLPGSVTFIPGVVAAAKASDLSDWYLFSPQSPIPAASEWSLSSWLEAPAGKHGRIVHKGDQLIYNGQPIKLWGINNSFMACAPDNELADKRADFYAAMGINSVRLHKYADGTGWAGILTQESAVEFDPVKLDRMDYYVAALKKRGIYTKLSPVFIIDIGSGDRDRVPYMDELGSMKGNRISPGHGSLYLSTELQDLLIEQVVRILRHTNPYTGTTYAEEPAIAYVELYNEDSALFGAVSSAMVKSPTLRARGGALFAQWLKEKYQTKEAFVEAWGERAVVNCGILGNQKLPADESWAEDRIYPAGNPWFFDPTHLDTSQQPYKRRLLDTMAFLYELQNDVYTRYAQAIRKTGYKGEMITSNWHAGRMMSHFYNLHSDATTGTIDRHNYFGGGQRGGIGINASSMLTVPGSGLLSSSLQQVKGCAFMLSEWIHVLPNEWGVEGPAILGAYGMGLQGWDVSYAFQNGDDGTFSHAIGLQEWDATAPQFIGIFPAVSRQVLRGDVKESEVVHERNVHVPSLDGGKVGFDERTTQQWDIKTFTRTVFPAEALAVAKGIVHFTEAFEPTESFDITPYREGKTLVSSTQQLRWLAGRTPMDGHIEINSPGTQAIVGFADGQTATFDDATITPRSRYGAIYLSAQSKNGTLAKDQGILLTALARARNEGSLVIADSLLLSRGVIDHHKPAGPVVLEPVVAEIVLKRQGTPTVHLLDHSGVKTDKTVPVKRNRFTIDTGRDATPYYLITY